LKIAKADYSRIAEYYDDVRPAMADIWLSRIMEYGKITENSCVLEIGCGTGRVILRMSALKNATFYSLDNSEEMLRKAVGKDKERKIRWVLGDAHELPFRSSSFDCVYMALVLHHMEDKALALEEIYRTLKSGGVCVIMTKSHSQLRESVFNEFPGLTTIDLKRFPSIPSIKDLMAEMGFRNVYSRVDQHDEGYRITAEFLKRVRNKYISTLTLLSGDEFEKGFEVFQERVKSGYGDKIRWISKFNFVVGQK